MSYLNNFNYQILGQKANPKLVFLHGLMGFGSNWKTMARHFEDRFEILLYDQRGHGRSFQPAEYSLDDYADDLDKITAELGWNSFILVGHSLGGRVAVRFASRHPERVQKLIVVDIGPTSDMQSMLSIEDKINFVPTPFASRDEARAFFDGPFLQKYGNETVKQFFYANLESNERGEMDWRFSKPGIQKTLWQARIGDQWREWEGLKMPTLLVRGGNSVDLPKNLFDEILRRNPQIKGVEVPGAGHWVHVEKPQELLEIFETFI